jgi:hypothetical protein
MRRPKCSDRSQSHRLLEAQCAPDGAIERVMANGGKCGGQPLARLAEPAFQVSCDDCDYRIFTRKGGEHLLRIAALQRCSMQQRAITVARPRQTFSHLPKGDRNGVWRRKWSTSPMRCVAPPGLRRLGQREQGIGKVARDELRVDRTEQQVTHPVIGRVVTLAPAIHLGSAVALEVEPPRDAFALRHRCAAQRFICPAQPQFACAALGLAALAG